MLYRKRHDLKENSMERFTRDPVHKQRGMTDRERARKIMIQCVIIVGQGCSITSMQRESYLIFYTTSVSRQDSQKAYEKFFANKGGALAKVLAKKKATTAKEDEVIRQE